MALRMKIALILCVLIFQYIDQSMTDNVTSISTQSDAESSISTSPKTTMSTFTQSTSTGQSPTSIHVLSTATPKTQSNPTDQPTSIDQKTVPSSVSTGTPPTTAPVNGTKKVDPAFVTGLISSLVPGASGLSSGPAANAMGPFGLLPAISKLSTPLAHIITAKGEPSVDDVDQLLKAVPDVAALLGLSGLLGGSGASALENLDVSKIPPQLVNFVAGGGQIPGVSAADMQKLIQKYSAQMAGGLQTVLGSQSVAAPNFTSWTQQQINDLINGKIALPPMSSLPPEYVQTVLSGGALPGLTLDQTQSLKQRYTQQMFNGASNGLQSMFGGLSKSGPMIGTISANITNSLSMTNPSNENTLAELKNLDLSRLPPDVLKSFLAGESLDLKKIPQDFLQSLINSPQLFANMVSAELRKKFGNDTHVHGESVNGLESLGGRPFNYQGRSAPYDVNSLDRKADISMYRRDENDRKATMWTAVVLALVGLMTVILIIILCWRRYRKQKRHPTVDDHPIEDIEATTTGTARASHVPNIINPTTTDTLVINEATKTRISPNSGAIGGGNSSDKEQKYLEMRNDRDAYTQNWIYSSGRRNQPDDGITPI